MRGSRRPVAAGELCSIAPAACHSSSRSWGLLCSAAVGLRTGSGGLELREGEKLPLPDNIRDAVLLRAAGLDDVTHTALGVAAALGQRFDPDLAAALAGLDSWPAEALGCGFVVEDADGSLAFRHDLVREAFYDAVPWAQRPALHRQIAERLQERGASLATVAEHWAEGSRA